MEKRDCRHCAFAVPVQCPCGQIVLVCANYPQSRGEMKTVPGDGCRNFEVKRGPRGRTDPAELPEPPDDSIRYIPLTQGQHAIVDAADYEWLSQYRWHAFRSSGRCYARRQCDKRAIIMHRAIMQTPPGMVVDHINGNCLDQRRSNMRNCSPQQNQLNTRPHKGASGFKGVHRCGNRWKAHITYRGARTIIGLFDDPVEAAKARDRKAVELLGEYAWLNFPEDAQKYKSQIAEGRSQIMSLRAQRGNPACGLNGDADGKPQRGGPFLAGDAESRVTTAYRSPRVSRWQPSPRSSPLTMPPRRSRLLAAVRLAGRTLRRDETSLTGCVPPGMANTIKTPRSASGGYGPEIRVPLPRPPLFARGPPWMIVAPISKLLPPCSSRESMTARARLISAGVCASLLSSLRRAQGRL